MEAGLLRAEQLAPALHQRVEGEGDQRPQSDAPQQDEQQAKVERRAGGEALHRASTLLLMAAVGITQLVWVAALGYGAVWVWQSLPV